MLRQVNKMHDKRAIMASEKNVEGAHSMSQLSARSADPLETQRHRYGRAFEVFLLS